jgi:hypothetical protein
VDWERFIAPDDALRVSTVANEWFLTPLEDDGQDPGVAEALGRIPHGEVSHATINFRMPPGLSLVDVEREFNDALAPRNFNAFLASEDGTPRLVEIGLPPTAQELVCIRPRVELHLLARALRVAIERVMAAQVRTGQIAPKTSTAPRIGAFVEPPRGPRLRVSSSFMLARLRAENRRETRRPARRRTQ